MNEGLGGDLLLSHRYQLVNDSTSTIVLLHGIQTNKSVFDAWFKRDEFRSYSILAIDLAGFGASLCPKAFSFSIQEQAELVRNTIEGLNISVCHIVGHSLGGMIGTALLAMLPKKVISLVNIEGNLQFADCGASKTVPSYSFQEFQTEYHPRLLESLERLETPSAEVRKRFLKKLDLDVFYNTAKEIVASSASGVLLKIFTEAGQPKCLIVGAQGRYMSRPKGDKITIKTVEGDHFLFIDYPDQTIQVIDEFIREISPS